MGRLAGRERSARRDGEDEHDEEAERDDRDPVTAKPRDRDLPGAPRLARSRPTRRATQPQTLLR